MQMEIGHLEIKQSIDYQKAVQSIISTKKRSLELSFDNADL